MRSVQVEGDARRQLHLLRPPRPRGQSQAQGILLRQAEGWGDLRGDEFEFIDVLQYHVKTPRLQIFFLLFLGVFPLLSLDERPRQLQRQRRVDPVDLPVQADGLLGGGERAPVVVVDVGGDEEGGGADVARALGKDGQGGRRLARTRESGHA